MGKPSTESAAGVVLVKGRTRVWVERGALCWKRGRTTVTVPGEQIRQIEAADDSLVVHLFERAQSDTPMTVRHRNRAVVAAVGAEIEAIMRDVGPSGDRRPVR